MKTKFFKMILPVAVIAFGVLGAISTNAATAKGTLYDTWGYIHDEELGICVQTDVMCKTDGIIPCTLGGVQLYEAFTPSSCPNALKKRN